MTLIGYTMMGEQAGPKQLVRDVALAEEAGFDFAVISDHYFPWLEAQGHAPYAWSVLGAAAQATDRIPLMTYVTCPILRYHPPVVAQKAVTMQILSGALPPRAWIWREPERARRRHGLACRRYPLRDVLEGRRYHLGPLRRARVFQLSRQAL